MRLIGDVDVLGRTVLEALPEVAAQGFIELLDQVYRTGEPYSGAGVRFVSHARPNGVQDERYLDFVYQPMKDATGAVTGVFVVGVDVTDRTLAEARLREQAGRLQQFNESLETAVAGAGRAQGARRRSRVDRRFHSGR
jgi:PAS domain-containing protein